MKREPENARPKGRGVTKLTHEQNMQLNHIQNAESAYWEAKRNLKSKLQKQLDEELGEFLHEREKAIFEGIQMGIPKKRIYEEGLGTTSPNYVYDVEKRLSARQEFVDVQFAKKVHRFGFGKIFAWYPDTLSGIFMVTDEHHPDVHGSLNHPEFEGFLVTIFDNKIGGIQPKSDLVENDNVSDRAAIEEWVKLHYHELEPVEAEQVTAKGANVTPSQEPDGFADWGGAATEEDLYEPTEEDDEEED